MSITIELTPEQEARLLERFGNPTAAQTWLESVVAATMDRRVPAPEPTAKKLRTPGLGKGSILYIAEDFDEPLPDSFWLGDDL